MSTNYSSTIGYNQLHYSNVQGAASTPTIKINQNINMRDYVYSTADYSASISNRKVPFMPKSAGKNPLSKFLSKGRKIKPGHVITIAMLGLMAFSRIGMSGMSGTKPQQASEGAQKLYNLAIQHKQDSLKIVELERKLAQDSLNVAKKICK